ncbi:MAG: DUF411 domain-containing protein [Stellaceae bacterium]
MGMISRRSLLAASALVPLIPAPVSAAPIPVKLYKNPQCSCCEAYADYLRQNGFTVEVVPSNDLVTMARDKGVPEELDGCHISMIGGYVVIGHVPIDAIRKLLAEQPKIVGISIPGMPAGLPGMPGPRDESIAIYEIAAGAAAPKVFMTAS